MLRLIILIISIFFSINSLSQQYSSALHHINFDVNQNTNIASNNTISNQIPITSNIQSMTPIWSEDFSNGIPSNWINSTVPWEFRGPSTTPNTSVGSRGAYSGANNTPPTNSPINSPTSLNGFMIFDSDYYDNYGIAGAFGTGPYPSNPNGHIGTLTTESIDLSAYSAVSLIFNSYYREYAGIAKVAFSIDGGLTFTNEMEVHPDIDVNGATTEDYEVMIHLPPNIAGQPSVHIQFKYDGTVVYNNYLGYYFWMIDDIKLIETPANLIECSNENFGGYFSSYGINYTFNPMAQALGNPYRLEGVVRNLGANAQNNVTLHGEMADDAGTVLFSDVSNPINLAVAAVDTLAINSFYTPTSMGLHNVSIWASSDSFPTTDTATMSTIVTDSIYGIDYDWNSDGANLGTSAWRIGRTCGGQVGANLFYIYTDDTVTSISFHVGSESVVGAQVTTEIYEGFGTNSTYLAYSDPYQLTAADIGNWVTVPLLNPVPVYHQNYYMAAVRGFAHPTDTFTITVAENPYSYSYIQDNGCNLNPANPPGTWYTATDKMAIRMNLGENNSTSQSNLFCEDFESFSNGDPIAQSSPNWNTWGELMSGLTPPFSDDAYITNTYSNNGSNSLAFNLNTGVAGPEDVLLPLNNVGYPTPFTTGEFTLTQNLYIVSGAYFNFQAENMPGVTWALEVIFDAMGGVNYASTGGAQSYLMSTYPTNQWFEQKIVIDLTTNTWEVFHDGISQGSFSSLVNQIASIDYYPTAGQEFYVDDICLDYIPLQLDPLNAQLLNITPLYGLAGQDRNPSLEVRNLGTNDINSFDVTFDYSGTQITESVSGLSLTSMQSYTVDFANTITLTSATTATAYIHNINGGQLQNTSDDTLTTSINVIVPAPGKLVIGERATGTWNGWCPRGIVNENWMHHKYEGYFQGIAVHNGDPMVDPTYDNGIAGYISGYPSGLIDRGGNVDPTQFEQEFLQNIVSPPSVQIQNSSTRNNDTLTVNMNLSFVNSISGSLKVACVLVEDSVTGSGPQYYQANYYSGGTSLVDVDGTDWNAKPSNVPDYMMVYRNVARSIQPSFLGEALPTNFYSIGQTENMQFNFYIDPSWNLNNLKIVSFLIDGSGQIDNASATKYFDALCDISTQIIATNPSDSSTCDGVIIINSTSSYPITNYSISDFQGNLLSSNNFAFGLCNGVYFISVIDSSGCSFLDTLALGIVGGCLDSNALNYNSYATYDDGSCIYPTILGCTDSNAYNYDPQANTDDGSCLYCDLTNSFFISQNTPGLCDGYIVAISNSSNLPISYLWNTGSTQNNILNLCDGIYSVTITDYVGCSINDTVVIGTILGCTDPLALNYDPYANSDDGSCIFCDLSNSMIVSQNTPGNCDGYAIANSSSSYGPISYLWSTGSTQNNITNLCSGTYTVTISDNAGCVIEDTVYIGIITGCTDPNAINYNPNATVDDGSCTYCVYGCTDPLALNYDPNATCDDGSCSYSSNCTSPKPTGLYAYDVIDTRAKIGWDNMNDPNCMVWKYFVRYREVGTSQWTTKSAGVGNGLCNFGLNTVTKQLLNLTPSTTYEFRMKAFYCGGTSSNYSTPVQFTTADVCPDMTNLTATTFNGNQAKVRFDWDTTGSYTFARILLRVDTAGSVWQTAGGFGVYYPTLFVNKFGLTPGQSYRAQGRTFCDSNITAYRSPTWTAPIFWTQPGSIREGGGLSINNLDIYPNPSRDVFYITFNSDEKQNLRIRILSVVGAEVYREDKENFIGEYTKQVSLDNYGKGIYFLEIETNTGIINKKLILQ